MDKYLTSRGPYCYFLGRHEEHRGHRRGHLRPGRCLSPEPPPPGAPLRKGGASGRPHQHGADRRPRPARVPLDTGFLVHNDRTYPNLVRLFGELGVATRDSDMSFAVSCRRTGLEYSSRGANGFFAQRRNLVKPVAPLPAPGDRALQSGSAGAARCAGRGTPDARRLSRVAPFRRGVHPSLSVSHGVGHLVGLARRDPIVSGAHAHPLLRQPRAALAPCAADVESGRRRQPHLHSQAHGAAVGRHSRAARRFRGAAKRARRHDHLPRSPVDGVRRGGVRVPRRSGAAAARRSQRPRARGLLELHHHDQRGVAAHRRVGAAGAGRARARRGITCSPPTPRRRRW